MRSEGYCSWVCVSVCLLSHISPMERLFVLKTLSRTQLATKVKKFVGFSLKPLRCRDPAPPPLYGHAYSRPFLHAYFSCTRMRISRVYTRMIHRRGFSTLVLFISHVLSSAVDLTSSPPNPFPSSPSSLPLSLLPSPSPSLLSSLWPFTMAAVSSEFSSAVCRCGVRCHDGIPGVE